MILYKDPFINWTEVQNIDIENLYFTAEFIGSGR